jgi:hypothetical protein
MDTVYLGFPISDLRFWKALASGAGVCPFKSWENRGTGLSRNPAKSPEVCQSIPLSLRERDRVRGNRA